jgi:hypothetical protein
MPTELILQSQAESLKRGTLSMWTVYDHPKDFPHSYVARRFEVNDGGPTPTGDLVQGELSIIRKTFSDCGLVCLTRNPEDDPVIVEVWI